MAGPLGYNIAVFNYPTQEEANVTMDFSRYDGFSPSENENRMAMDQGDYAENYGPTVFHYTSIDSLHKIEAALVPRHVHRVDVLIIVLVQIIQNFQIRFSYSILIFYRTVLQNLVEP